MTACPPADQLLEFVSGALSDGDAAAIEAHIDGCASCRATLSALARSARAPVVAADGAHTPAAPPAAEPAFGRYRLDTVLGSGGMGIVYRAWDPQLARAVAIKVVKHANADEPLRARLVREAQSLARLSHPHVCHIYDVGDAGDELWIAMELIDGTSLRQWAAAPRRSRAALIDALLAAADGLAAAHAAGIVHRDVKPENVLVTRDDRAVVTDFGLARIDPLDDPRMSHAAADPKLTATGAITGTPAYLAPEQLAGSPIDARVDQFAWAVMAWELITGVRPFPIAVGARLDAIRAGVTPPPDLAPPVAAALARALSAAPRDRFASMRELIEAVRSPPAAGGDAAPADRAAVAADRLRSTRLIAMYAGGFTVIAAIAVVAIWILNRADDPRRAPTTIADVRQPDVQHSDAQLAAVRHPDAQLAAVPHSDVQPPDAQLATVRHPDTRPPTIRAAANATTPTATRPPPPLAIAPPRHTADPGDRGKAEAILAAFCHLPYDAAKPDAALGQPIVDWGKVTRRDAVTADVAGRPMPLVLYEVKGQRRIYRFNGSAPAIGELDAAIGELVVVCTESDTDIYRLPAPWTGTLDTMTAFLRVSAPPRITSLAALAPLHIREGQLERDGTGGKLTLAADRRYLVYATLGAIGDDGRFDMKHWWLEVPAGIRGASLATTGAARWIVVEQPTLEDQPTGKPHLIVRAAAIVDEMFPP